MSDQLKNVVTAIQSNQSRSGEYCEVAIPFDTTFLFDYPNVTTAEVAGGTPIVIFKIVLDSDKIISFKDDGCFLDFAPFKDNITMEGYSGDGLCYMASLSAGTYYVICADFSGKLQNEGAFIEHITFTEVAPIELTYPVDQDITLTYANIINYQGGKAAVCAVTLPSFGTYDVLSTMTFVGSSAFGVSINVEDNVLLPDGRIIFALVDYSGSVSETSDLTTHLTMLLDEAILPTQITLPYSEDIEITAENSIFLWDYYYVKFYQFTLTSDTYVHFWSENALNENYPYFEVTNSDMSYRFGGSNFAAPFSAGTYYLIVEDDAHILNGASSVAATIHIVAEVHYDQLDYSKEITETPIYSSMDNLTAIVQQGTNYFAEGFHFNAEAGKAYKLHCESFANGLSQETYTYVTMLLLSSMLTGDINVDVLDVYQSDMYGHNRFTIEYGADANGVIKVLLCIGEVLPSELLYSLYFEVEDAPVFEAETPNTESGWTWETMTLPFERNLVFDTVNYNGWKDENCTFKPFVLTLTEDTQLDYLVGWNNILRWYSPLDIYRDAAMTDFVGEYWATTSISLTAGTYFILFSMMMLSMEEFLTAMCN